MRMGHASEVPVAIANRTDAPNIDPRRPAPSAERRIFARHIGGILLLSRYRTTVHISEAKPECYAPPSLWRTEAQPARLNRLQAKRDNRLQVKRDNRRHDWPPLVVAISSAE